MDEAFTGVSDSIRDAALAVSKQLSSLGVRHALAGDLAVGAHGHPHATEELHFLVGDEAYVRSGALMSLAPGVPVYAGGFLVEYSTPTRLGSFVEAALEHPSGNGPIPVVAIEVLIVMLLVAGRRRHLADTVALLRAGADRRSIRAYLATNADDLLPEFDALVEEALD